MSDLQPKGVPITLGDVERHILFTFSAIDEIQAHYDMPIGDVLLKMSDDREAFGAVAYIMTVLVNDEIARRNYYEGKDEKEISLKEMNWMLTAPEMGLAIGAILLAYGNSLPEADEDDDPNAESRSS